MMESTTQKTNVKVFLANNSILVMKTIEAVFPDIFLNNLALSYQKENVKWQNS